MTGSPILWPGLVKAYEKELFRFDQLYRHFCEQADIAESRIWDILKRLREKVEACYVNGYLHPLSDRWGNLIDPKGDTALMKSWRLDDIPNQYHFFRKHVAPRLKEAERRRSFVVISDAFRYEAAEELTRELNGRYRFEADLSAQLAVLPSYTTFGMAALLPHEKLAYKSNGDVLVDGKPMAGLEQRSRILASHEGLAVKADDLLEMKKDQGHKNKAGHGPRAGDPPQNHHFTPPVRDDPDGTGQRSGETHNPQGGRLRGE